PAFSSATERRDARRAEPQSERERRNRDDPPPRFAARADERGGRDDEQTDGQSAEKQAESAPLHARTLFLRQRSLPLPLVLAVALALLLLEQLVGALLPLLLRPVHVFLRLIGHAGKMPKTEGYNLHRTQGRSSVGRAAVSKTVGRGFESLRPCWLGRRFRVARPLAPLRFPARGGRGPFGCRAAPALVGRGDGARRLRRLVVRA